jgi:hypothetical protein
LTPQTGTVIRVTEVRTGVVTSSLQRHQIILNIINNFDEIEDCENNWQQSTYRMKTNRIAKQTLGNKPKGRGDLGGLK